MRRIGFACWVVLGICAAEPATARNDIYHLPIDQALKDPDTNGRFTNFALVFGDQPATGYQTIGEYVATERSHFHGRTEEMACQANFLEALADLKERSLKVGGNAVIGIVSFYRNVTYSSTTQYECHAGANGVFVWLKGVYAKTR